MSDLMIVLLGKTGAGKSASGNTIIGGDKDTFKYCFSSQSGTKICRTGQTEVNKHKITVIDTIGFADTSLSPSALQNKSDQVFACTLGEDIDVFLLVIKLGDRYTQEEQNIVKLIQETFGAKALKHTIVLFTHGDLLHEPVEMYLSKHDTLRSVVDQCSGGYQVFDNKSEDQTQVIELLRKIEILRMKNGTMRYTKNDYEGAQEERLKHERAEKERLEHERAQRKHHGLSTEAVLGSVVGGVLAAAVVGVLYILKN